MERVHSRLFIFSLFSTATKKTNGIIFQSNVSSDLKCLEHYRIELFRVTGFSNFFFFSRTRNSLVEKRYLHVYRKREKNRFLNIYLSCERQDRYRPDRSDKFTFEIERLSFRPQHLKQVPLPWKFADKTNRDGFSLRIGSPVRKLPIIICRMNVNLCGFDSASNGIAWKPGMIPRCFILQPPVWINRSIGSGGNTLI